MHTFCFLRTKPRLSQAGALLLPKDFVSLGNKNFTMTKIHFRSYSNRFMLPSTSKRTFFLPPNLFQI